ncbi:MAG: tyrosine recombinase XerC [Clostridia bacterium]|nr:tyrosine recombinase XerC [Clostridia bacterium]
MKVKIITNDTPQIIKEFLSYMQVVKGKSKKTVDEYFLDLRTFFRYIKLKKNLVALSESDFAEISISDISLDLIKEITLTDVYDFFNYLCDNRKNNASTRARKVSALRSFFNYLADKTHQINENPIKDLDTPKRKAALPKFLTLEESLELLKTVKGPYKERDYCILTLFLNCGMRLSELVNIDLYDIRDDGTVRLTGKGNKERVIYLNQACIEAIQNYLKVRSVEGVRDRQALFISKQKKRISPKTVQALVYKYLTAAKLDNHGFSVHKLRHTAATLMYQHGNVDIRILKDILGHSNLGTTEIYTHLSSKQMKKAASANPLAKLAKNTNT